MEIKYREILLRDMQERDIDDEIRWNTVETQWALWDAPWEMEVELPKFDPETFRKEALENLKQSREAHRWGFELDTLEGVHIGSVSSYLIDENWEWIRQRDVKPGQRTYRTLGIEICDSRYWSRGLGRQALTAFVLYNLERGETDLCLQTWSGNVRMIRCAERLGFRECNREVGNRQVRGGVYDGLTFRLDRKAFYRFLLEENLRELKLDCGNAVLDAYDARPDFFWNQAALAYGEGYPICSRSPLERLVIWCCLLTKVRQRYQSANIPYPVFQDTISDIALRAGLYSRKYGKPGLSKADAVWFRHLHNCQIFQLGALQFQLFSMAYLDKAGCGEDYMTFSPEVQHCLPPGSPVVNVHIPEGADLSPERVAESLREAAGFFSRYFPGHGAKAFVCYSWLLYPPMQELLPEDSRIRAFAKRFRIVGQVSDPYGSEAVSRIYGRRFPRKADYPQETTLQRNALGNFSKLGMACGILDRKLI